ncbi:hypothetical protein [Octadecabacter ascidiaceicola]|uniref:Uncharacterized protein n=1 Tax=Octadecabacter ascidiaceicola TaxID=1655543 RepID=A0A238JQ91_9RHOB|nr:hypothetical protein [Octadecabacter ascidiaceicola]SMX31926.1 hypothetical protein OCA8868_00570 [Octadecabacter ascidiaceicola]
MTTVLSDPFNRVIKTSAALAVLLGLTACGGPLAPNELRLDNDGNGRFSGSAGAGWTSQELYTHISASFCDGADIADFQILVLDGGQVVSGQCVLG